MLEFLKKILMAKRATPATVPETDVKKTEGCTNCGNSGLACSVCKSGRDQ